MSQILDPNNMVAGYLIQISTVFRPNTTNLLGSINLWKKGGFFGSSDELLKFCPANGCLGFHTDTFSLSEREAELVDGKDLSEWPLDLQDRYAHWFELPVVCPKCGTISSRYDLPDSYGFNMNSARIAERASQFFSLLNGDADLYLVRTKEENAFQKARSYLYEHDRNFSKYQKKLESARDRDCVFYSLKRIIADTASGSELSSRIKALIEA